MAKQVKLKAERRTATGRSAARKLKARGAVPAIIYGAKDKPQPLQLSARDIHAMLSHASGENILVELEIDGEKSNRMALVKEIQHSPVGSDVLHVDFHAVSATEKITSEVPIEAVGDALGVRTFGGLLEYSLRTLEVECFPQDLPEIVRIDVTNLNIGEALHVRDIPLPSGVESLTDGDLTVVSVVASRVGEEVVETAETPATPEVITEKKGEAKTETPQSS